MTIKWNYNYFKSVYVSISIVIYIAHNHEHIRYIVFLSSMYIRTDFILNDLIINSLWWAQKN